MESSVGGNLHVYGGSGPRQQASIPLFYFHLLSLPLLFFFPGIVAAGWGAHWPLPMNFKTTLPCTPSWTPQVEGYRIPLGLDGAPGQGKKEKRNVEGWRKSMEDGEAELKTQRERFYY